MSEQQIISQDEKRRKNIAIHHNISKIFFIAFLILFCFSLLSLHTGIILVPEIIRKPFGLLMIIFEFLILPAYIVYLIASTVIVFQSYKKILFFNAIAILIIIVYSILNLTGFCFEEGRYLSKREIIDTAFERMEKICKKEQQATGCPTYEEIRQKYPQCFGENISNECTDKVSQYSSKFNKTFNTYFTVYRLEKDFTLTPIPMLWIPGFHIYTDIEYRKRNPNRDYPDYMLVMPCGEN
jgi:hypothetical protein